MKCQKCDKVATYHFTDLINACPEELHLCDTHAYEYLHQNDAKHSPTRCAARKITTNRARSQRTKRRRFLTEELTNARSVLKMREHTFLDLQDRYLGAKTIMRLKAIEPPCSAFRR